MGNPFSNRAGGNLENETIDVFAFIALDGAANVIGFAPTASPPTAVGPYSRVKGFGKSIGPAGAVITQPHTATGVYIFTLDEPWFGMVGAGVQLTDQGAVAAVNPFVDANVGPNTLGGAFPGNNPALAAQTVRVRFRTASAGALADPVVSTGFWLWLELKRTGV